MKTMGSRKAGHANFTTNAGVVVVVFLFKPRITLGLSVGRGLKDKYLIIIHQQYLALLKTA